MKKNWMMILAVLLVMALVAGCAAPATSPTSQPPEVTDTTTPPMDTNTTEPTDVPSEDNPVEDNPVEDQASPFAQDIKEAIHQVIKEDGIAGGVPEENYQDGQLSGYLFETLPAGFDNIPQSGIDASLVEDGVVAMAMINVKSDMIYVLKAVDEAASEKLEEQLEQVHADQVQVWEQYLPDQYEKVKNAIIEKDGLYLYYIVYDNPEKLEDAIQGALAEA